MFEINFTTIISALTEFQTGCILQLISLHCSANKSYSQNNCPQQQNINKYIYK